MPAGGGNPTTSSRVGRTSMVETRWERSTEPAATRSGQRMMSGVRVEW